MKVILLQDIKKLGKKGEIIETAEGYGRNYLIPRGMAEEATSQNLNQAKRDQQVAAHRKAQAHDEAVILASQLEKVTLHMKVSANGKLFGSIASKDVAEALLAQTGMEGVDRRKIEIPEVIKSPGEYKATAKLMPDITATFKVLVETEE
jgi:large subunit ribosomal protein L9